MGGLILTDASSQICFIICNICLLCKSNWQKFKNMRSELSNTHVPSTGPTLVCTMNDAQVGQRMFPSTIISKHLDARFQNNKISSVCSPNLQWYRQVGPILTCFFHIGTSILRTTYSWICQTMGQYSLVIHEARRLFHEKAEVVSHPMALILGATVDII